MKKIKEKIGNKCSKEGFINKESIKILRRTLGTLQSFTLKGTLIYEVEYKASICKPQEGQEIITKIANKNKVGLFCTTPIPLSIVVPLQQHNNDKLESKYNLMKNIEIGDTIKIKIIAKRFKLNTDKIFVVGEFIEKI